MSNRAQHHHAEPVDVEQRQHADDAIAGADGPLRLLPGLVHGDHGGEIAVREHRRLRQAGGAAGILQERDVIDADFGQIAGRRFAFLEPREGELPLVLGKRRERNGEGPQAASSPTISRSMCPAARSFCAVAAGAGEVHGDQRARAAVGELVHQHALDIERAQVRHARAGIERAEERDRMKGRVREIERDRACPARCRAAGSPRRPGALARRARDS